jgi:5-(carboxyamino)imidazole ribonucleotide synthase
MLIESKIGILGGGQLCRMLCMAGASWNLNIKVMDSKECPASSVCNELVVGNITEYQDVLDFGRTVDVLTLEIENVNIEALEQLEKEGVKIFPKAHTLRIIQDKGLQKQFYKNNSIPSSEFKLFSTKLELEEFLSTQKTFVPFVQKSRIGGYDGRGVELIKSPDDFFKILDCPSLIEDLVEIDKELSVIIAKNPSEQISYYPAALMKFDQQTNLVNTVITPSQINNETEQKAQELAINIVNQLDFVGILSVEMFLTKTGQLLVNEIAPRTHNSGHHTIEGAVTSQFEQQLRAILDLPLGDTSFLKPAGMLNIVGKVGDQNKINIKDLQELLKIPNIHLHLYGKKESRPGRKMGHITVLGESIEEIEALFKKLNNELSKTSSK